MTLILVSPDRNICLINSIFKNRFIYYKSWQKSIKDVMLNLFLHELILRLNNDSVFVMDNA